MSQDAFLQLAARPIVLGAPTTTTDAGDSGVPTVFVVGAVFLASLGAVFLLRRETKENPTKERSLTVKGRKVSFEFANGKKLRLPAADGMLHDLSGRHLPKGKLFFGPVSRTSSVAQKSGEQAEYFGDNYEARVAKVERFEDLRTRSWAPVGDVSVIRYERLGTAHPDYYFHDFHPQRGERVVLAKHGKFYRLESTTRPIIATWRGIVTP
jgi:hypothetical protein